MEDSNFVTQFYNIQGDLIPERKKNFFKLLKAQSSPLLEEDLEHLKPRTYLEKLFQIDIFIHFKLSQKLLEVIKEGNEVFISKILKHPLILKETLGTISAESFVNDFLPCTSYALRMKILKRISFFMDECQMDDIVTSVHNRYGLSVAVKLVHTCTSEKIRNFLSNHDVLLKPRQVKYIFDKDPELLYTYLQHNHSLTDATYKHKNINSYIALKNPDLWLKLEKNCLIQTTKLGRKTTKRIIIQNNDDVIANFEFYMNFIKYNDLLRELRGNFATIFQKFFPKEIDKLHGDSYNTYIRLLKCHPKKTQWQLFEQTFIKIFGKNIMDNLIYLDNSFIKLFPNKTVLNNWGEVQYNKDFSNEFLKYCSTSKAIPLIKEKINVTSDMFERRRLINLLLENCSINEDMLSLEGVLKYICFRHKNEEKASLIFQEVKRLFGVEKLNETHWTYLNELITYVKLKDNHLHNYLYEYEEYTLYYIMYLIMQGRAFKKELTELLEYLNSIDRSLYVSHLYDPKIEKQIWKVVLDIYPETTKANKQPYNNWEYIIVNVLDFIHRNPEHTFDISSTPDIQANIAALLKKDVEKLSEDECNILQNIIRYNYYVKDPARPIVVMDEINMLRLFEFDLFNFCCSEVMSKIICKHNRSEFENKVLELYWNDIHFPIFREIWQWFFFNEPKTIIPHIDNILAQFPEFFCTMNVKLMSHLNFDQELIKCCVSKFKVVDEYLAKSASGDTAQINNMCLDVDVAIFKILCILMSVKDFLKFIENRFLPAQNKLDVKDNTSNRIFALQCVVAGTLKKLQEPSEALPIVMKFCIGDYLQSALPSLYSICYRTPEKELHSYIDILFTRAVSARKHALFLTCELMPYNNVLHKLQTINETNVSSQKHIFSATVKYFRRNPSDELLSLVVKNLDNIDKNDVETLKSLVSLNIPKKYIKEYTQKCWYFLENLRTKDVKVKDYLQRLFDNRVISLEEHQIVWPVDFYSHVVTYYFIDDPETDYNIDNIEYFVCLILRNHLDIVDVKLIFDKIVAFKKNRSTGFIRYFFDKFFKLAIRDIESNNKIDKDNNYYIQVFKENWHNIFSPVEKFDEHILINLLYLRSKVTDVNFTDDYAKEVIIYFQTVFDEYGLLAYNRLKQILMYKNLFTKEKQFLFFLHGILKYNDCAVNCILVIECIHLQGIKCNGNTQDVYKNIMETLKNKSDPIVSIYFNTYFNNKNKL